MKRNAFGLFVTVAIALVGAGAAAANALAPTVVAHASTSPAAKVSASGKWKIDVSSGRGLGSGYMFLNQAGGAVVGTFDQARIDGKIVTDNKVAARWTNPNGAGWLSLWLDEDGASLHGEWGWNAKSSSGRFVGHRVEGK